MKIIATYQQKINQQNQLKIEQKMDLSIFPKKYIDAIECTDLSYVDEIPGVLFPPINNMGGITNYHLNTMTSGLTPPVSLPCIIDYLSLTFRPDADDLFLFVLDFITNLEKYLPQLKHAVRSGGMYGYKHTVSLSRSDVQAGIIGFGGNDGTVYLSLSGVGCSGVDMHTFKAYLMTLPSAKITRVDLAHDDLEGKQSVQDYRSQYLSGDFAIKGTSPGARFLDDFGSGKGCTLYVGHKKNGKECCIYEKGKQLGDKESPWVRVEGRLAAVDRVIPFDVLIEPGQYLAALYPPFSLLSSIHKRIEIVKKVVQISYDSLLEYASVSYGKLVNFMLEQGHDASYIVTKLVRSGVPRRLAIPVAHELALCPF